ncbi:collagen alpha-1(XXV) chain-like [Salvelinus namaycush]|uniref:Collagen alpha-1(XXV) chain-like n=1 Tax=Salvelinus namaycush TaxID=8040 RepID=A0A8U0QCS2_SALNM|nr:collagen alpha-1(XXV) chain-like [Salvelinus namaycush]
MTWVQGSKVTRVTRASQGSTDHREREESWSQGQRVNQDLTDPLGYLVYLGKMERSTLRVRLVCQDCEGQRVRGKGIPGEKGDQGFPGQHGPQGERGVVEPGTKGEPGPDGSSGIPGILGEDGAVDPKGEIGLPGLRGTEGAWERNSWRKG